MIVTILIFLSLPAVNHALIDRRALVSRYNPVRTSGFNLSTPVQVGNGNFAFGADVTGLQTFSPFAIMSSWGWKNDSLPPGRTWEDVKNYHGVSYDNHGRPVEYDFGGDPLIEQWLISNPNRVNLGRVGLVFFGANGSALETTLDNVSNTFQTLDLWTGTITSNLTFDGVLVSVATTCAQESDIVGISIASSLVSQGRLGVFIDFPWNDGSNKFSAPFVGSFNLPGNHTTTLHVETGPGAGTFAQITHTLVNSTFLTTVGGNEFNITRDAPDLHRYTIRPRWTSSDFTLVVGYSLDPPSYIPDFASISTSSHDAWARYWSDAGFVDVISGSTDPRADELQRRIVLSRYLMRVNEAGDSPPQESGLVNDGWYGKFHMEMYFWHCAHWALWDNWDLLHRSTPTYSHFLPSSIQRAQVQQGFATGARWPKMTDPLGRSSPGEINNLLIWEQPHPLIFASYERRSFPDNTTVLQKWRNVLHETADFMAAFAWFNRSTGVFDIGPPMYPVAEDTNPNITRNPAFELAYWRFGLGLASEWMSALEEDVPVDWTDVLECLAPLPMQDGYYAIYEDAPKDFWSLAEFTSDHPTLAGLVGWLPPTLGLNISVANATTHRVWTTWNATNLWGWDFPMLAMSAARLGDPSQAVNFLLHPDFQFDDVGMPVGGVRVPTPYFPGAGALLYAIAMMAEGWEGSTGHAPGFPKGWNVTVEGLSSAL
ncbi:Six-hairpin glycosidase-like protein [Vararia minispora EC-137]|uniref:Six-hairpin glycosidase-like protein n=1 Tax=Vararia minispora EC-137 TaxID=1314806 RepID=A0ACB8QFE4_9AGAM|nr:Six-hairpin glycosidase-like protein [Vararia minispora EC-137]